MSTDSQTNAAPGSPLKLLNWALEFVGELFLLVAQSIGFLLKGRVDGKQILRQMSAIGTESLPIVMATTFSTGAVFAYYTAGIFVKFGATPFVGGTLVISVLLELGPLLAGVTVAARSGAAIAAEIGSMVVTEQVDALRALAMPPVRYLVAPRLIGALLMAPFVCAAADVAGVAGSYFMSLSAGVPSNAFLDSAKQLALPSDLWKGLIKSLVFAVIITIVASRQGLKTEGGATGVGRATTSSVVACVVLIFFSDFFIAQLLNGH